MKILFVTDLYPIGNEKIAKALYYFVQEWIKQGHKVEVIRSNFIINTKLRGRNLQREGIYEENGVKIYNINCHTPFLFNIYNKLPKYFSLNDYDVLISHMPAGAFMAEALLKKYKIKYVCAVHASDLTVLNKKQYSLYFSKKLKNIYKKADYIAARSPVLKDKIENLIPEAKGKTFIAYSGIDDELVDNIDKYNAKCLDFIYNKELSITLIASLIKRKNIDIVIRGLAQLKDRNFFLKIIGDGEEKDNLLKLTKELGLERNIKFTGNIKREEVFKHLIKSSVFVLLSQNETFGLCYLEALATLNIVIALKNDGIDGILKDKENAFLISQKPEELKECIESILNLNKEETVKLYNNIKSTVKQYKQSSAAQKYIENLQ